MKELLLSVDGPSNKKLDRMKLVIEKDAFRSFLTGFSQVCLWFQTDYFEDEWIDQEVYGNAILQWCGNVNTSYVFSSNPPNKNICKLTGLIVNYTLARMYDMTQYDVVLFCTVSKTYQSPPSRKIVYDKEKLDKKCCMFGRYSTVEERTPILELCVERKLSCIVVRALHMDEDNQKYEDYTWEIEDRVTSIYL